MQAGSMPRSWMADTTQQMLWQTNFAMTSFLIAVSDFAFTASPNFRLTMLNVDSTMLRRW